MSTNHQTLVIPDAVRQARDVSTGQPHAFKLVAPPPLDLFEVRFADRVRTRTGLSGP